MKTTDLDAVKEVAISFLYMDIQYHEQFPFLIMHPIFETEIVGMPNGEFMNLREGDNLKKVREAYTKAIKEASSYTAVMMTIRSSYQLTFLKFTKQYMSHKDFDEWLAHCWVACENPNQDKNVSISTFISWFKHADKRTIMNDEDYEYYCNLPDEVEIYRGVAVGRAEQKGLSWTANYDTAEWFAKRYDDDRVNKHGYILKAKIRKEDVLAYFNTRDEDELVCNSSKIYGIERISTNGCKSYHTHNA